MAFICSQIDPVWAVIVSGALNKERILNFSSEVEMPFKVLVYCVVCFER